MSDTNPAATETDDAKSSGLFSKLNVLLFLLAVLTGEALIAFLFIPTADDVATAAGQFAVTEVKDETTVELPGLELPGASESLHEFDMEAYGLAVPNLAAGTSLRVDFHLWGIVHENSQDEFKTLYGTNKHRIRDAVGSIIRRSEAADLAEPGLGLIKRKVFAKVNQTLGKPLLRGVVFSEFVFFEQ